MKKLLDSLRQALIALVVSGGVAVMASQGSLFSPTTGTVSGLQLTNSYNAAIDALNTKNSGATAPTNQLSGAPSAFNDWCDTSSSPYSCKTYDGSQWLKTLWIDPSNHLPIVPIGGGMATIASASTVDLCSIPQSYLTISGTVTITSLGSSCPAGSVKLVTFSAVLTLTYNATSLIIPGAANVVTAAGDQATLVSLGSGNWQVASYMPASGQALLNPSIDVGSYVMTAAVGVPSSKYLLAFGQPISRSTYSVLLGNVTITQSVTRTSGSPTLTGFTDTTQIKSGAAIEGSGIPSADTITSCASTTCTMAANATSSGTANVTIYPYGNGDGSTTFNMPECRGAALVARDNMGGTPRAVLTSAYYGTNPDALGALGGSQNFVLAQTNFPSISANVTVFARQETFYAATGGSTGLDLLEPSGGGGIQSQTYSVNSLSGSSAPVGIVQPSITANCMVRVLP